MKIYIDNESDFYSDKAKKLNLGITIYDNLNFYYYEFDIKDREAIVRYNDIKYIENASTFFHDMNKFITKIHDENNNFYEDFLELHVFKLPIKVILPTKFILSEKKYNDIDENISDLKNIYLPVSIIDDEYVLLDGHHRLFLLNENLYKMVYVYLDDIEPYINDLIYIGKEHNIKSISDLELVPDEAYNSIWIPFINEIMKVNT